MQTFAQWTPISLVITPTAYAGNNRVVPVIQVGPNADPTNVATGTVASVAMGYYVRPPRPASGINYKGMNQGNVKNSCEV